MFRPFSNWFDPNGTTHCIRLSANRDGRTDRLTPDNIANFVKNMPLEEIANMDEDVLLIEAATGSGKSVSVKLIDVYPLKI